MKTLKFNSGKLKTSIVLPRSKSYGNRALILASILPQAFTLKEIPESSDVSFLLTALEKIGLVIQKKENELTVLNSFPACEGSGLSIDIGEGGTTARFLAALLLRGQAPYTLILGSRLKERPWDEFLELVRKLGGRAQLKDEKLFLQGPLTMPEVLEVDCERTTQFASGFQLAWAFSSLQIIPQNLKTSQSYWRMTQEMIQTFRKASSFTIPMDWSSASYPLAFGALNQTIHFPGLVYDQFQADSKFLLLLEKLKAIRSQTEIEVSQIQASLDLQFDVHDCLDLVPTLGYFLSHLPGIHTLTGIENLIHKESDRLHDLIDLLAKFDRRAQRKGNQLVIEGSPSKVLEPVHLTLADDHRMVMVGALFLIHHQGGSLAPAEAVNKSYPGFFETFSPESFTVSEA
jgi:3-phosphoshikimate 1-carboxyvinyltransferase